jgi:hypothetical protein
VHDVFVNAYATAMRPTLAVAAAALPLGALICRLLVRRTQETPVMQPAGTPGPPVLQAIPEPAA